MNDTPGFLIFRNNPYGESNLLMQIIQCLLLGNLVFAVPLRVNPCRLQIYLFTKMQETNLNRYVISISLVIIATGVSYIYPNIAGACSIMGGTGSCLLSLIIPGNFFKI